MKRLTAFCLLFLPLLTGCALRWEPAWNQAGPDRPTARTETLFTPARACFSSPAADAAAVDNCIALHEAVLKDNPGHYQARVNAATLYILKGTAYTDASSSKSAAFSQAMRYAELAMYSNPDFKAKIDAGKQPWEAVSSLGAAETEAMFFWVTALQYEFKEGMSFPSKVINIAWMQRALVFLDRIETVAPEFGGGGVEVGKAICYMVLPGRWGGSDAKGDEYMKKAIARSDGWLLPRWAHGKYYLPVKGDKQAAAAELTWVATQDPSQYRDPYPWRVHFQSDARQMLRKANDSLQ